jgi:hypothetical protein
MTFLLVRACSVSRRIGAGILAQSPFNALQTLELEIRIDGAAIA